MHADTNLGKLKATSVVLVECGHSDHDILKLALCQEWIKEISWLFASWKWFNNFWLDCQNVSTHWDC